jgi:hypothetical protein
VSAKERQLKLDKEITRENEKGSKALVSLERQRQANLTLDAKNLRSIELQQRNLADLAGQGAGNLPLFQRAQSNFQRLPGLQQAGQYDEFARVLAGVTSDVREARKDLKATEKSLDRQLDQRLAIEKAQERLQSLEEAGATGPRFKKAESLAGKLPTLAAGGNAGEFTRTNKQLGALLSSEERSIRQSKKSEQQSRSRANAEKAVIDSYEKLASAVEALETANQRAADMAAGIYNNDDIDKLTKSFEELGRVDIARSSKRELQDFQRELDKAREKAERLEKSISLQNRGLKLEQDLLGLQAQGVDISGTLLPLQQALNKNRENGADISLRDLNNLENIVKRSGELVGIDRARIATGQKVEQQLDRQNDQTLAIEKRQKKLADLQAAGVKGPAIGRAQKLVDKLPELAAKGPAGAREFRRIDKQAAQALGFATPGRGPGAGRAKTPEQIARSFARELSSAEVAEQNLIGLSKKNVDASSQLVSIQDAINQAKKLGTSISEKDLEILKDQVATARNFVKVENARLANAQKASSLKAVKAASENRLPSLRRDSLTSNLIELGRARTAGNVFRGGRSGERAFSDAIAAFNAATSPAPREQLLSPGRSGGLQSLTRRGVPIIAGAGAEAGNAGQNVVDTFASKLSAGAGRILAAGIELGTASAKGIRKALKMNSPSIVIIKIVLDIINSWVKTMDAAIPQVEAVSKKLADASAQAIQGPASAEFGGLPKKAVNTITPKTSSSYIDTAATTLLNLGIDRSKLGSISDTSMFEMARGIVSQKGAYPIIENIPGIDYTMLSNERAMGRAGEQTQIAKKALLDFYGINEKGLPEARAGATSSTEAAAANVAAAEQEARQLGQAISELVAGFSSLKGLVQAAADMAKPGSDRSSGATGIPGVDRDFDKIVDTNLGRTTEGGLRSENIAQILGAPGKASEIEGIIRSKGQIPDFDKYTGDLNKAFDQFNSGSGGKDLDQLRKLYAEFYGIASTFSPELQRVIGAIDSATAKSEQVAQGIRDLAAPLSGAQSTQIADPWKDVAASAAEDFAAAFRGGPAAGSSQIADPWEEAFSSAASRITDTADSASLSGARGLKSAADNLFDSLSGAIDSAAGPSGSGSAGGPRPPSPPSGGNGPGDLGSRAEAARGDADRLLGLADIADFSKATSKELQIFANILSETRDTVLRTDKAFEGLNKAAIRAEDELVRRDPNSDFLTRRFGQRGGQAVGEGLIGGAFPLLFGQGGGAAAGGGLGGFFGGLAGGTLGFGLSLAGTAIGSQVDLLAQAAQDTGNILRDLVGNFDQIKEAGLLASRSQEKFIERLIEGGNKTLAYAVIQDTLNKKLGSDGAVKLRAAADAGDRLNRAIAELGLQMQIFIAGPLTALLNAMATVFERGSLESAIQRELGPDGKASPEAKAAAKERLDAATAAGGGIENAGKILGEVLSGKSKGSLFANVGTEELKNIFSDLVSSVPAGPQTEDQRRQQVINDAETRRDLAQRRLDVTTKLNEPTEIFNGLQRQLISARQEREDIERQGFELRRDYERQIEDIRIQVADRVTQIETENRQKELEILVKQGEVRKQQFENAATALRGALAGDPLAESLADAVTTYLGAQLSAQDQIEQRRKQFEIEISNQQLETEKFKLEVGRTLSRLNTDTAEKVAEINRGIARRNEEAALNNFNFEKKIAELRIRTINQDLLVTKAQEEGDIQAARSQIQNGGLSPETNKFLEDSIAARQQRIAQIDKGIAAFEAQIAKVNQLQPPPRISSVSAPATRSVSFAGVNQGIARAKQLREQLQGIEEDLLDNIKTDNLEAFANRLREIGSKSFFEVNNSLKAAREEAALASGDIGPSLKAITDSYDQFFALAASKGVAIEPPLREYIIQIRDAQLAFEKIKPSMEFYTSNLQDLTNQTKQARAAIDEFLLPTKAYDRILAQINARGGLGINPEDEERLLRQAKALDELNAKLKVLNALKDVASGWTDSFIQLNKELLKGGDLLESLQSFAEGFAERTLDVVLEFALRPIEENLFKNLSDFFGIKAPEDPALQPIQETAKNTEKIYNLAKETFAGQTGVKVVPETPVSQAPANSIVPGPAATRIGGPLGELLARIRSAEGGYTSVNRGIAGDTRGGIPGLDKMTVAQVMSLQRNQGYNAVGAYQFIPGTLEGAVNRSGIDRNSKFDRATQDNLALELILGGVKRPALSSYLSGKSNDIDAAEKDALLEWAGLKSAKGGGAYDGIAGNRGSVTIRDLLPLVRQQLAGQSSTTAANSGFLVPGSPLVAEPAPPPPVRRKLIPADLLGGNGRPIDVNVVDAPWMNAADQGGAWGLGESPEMANGRYTPGWITVPGKGRKWRTAEGEYKDRRPVSDVIMGWSQGAIDNSDYVQGMGDVNIPNSRRTTVSLNKGRFAAATPGFVAGAIVDELAQTGLDAFLGYIEYLKRQHGPAAFPSSVRQPEATNRKGPSMLLDPMQSPGSLIRQPRLTDNTNQPAPVSIVDAPALMASGLKGPSQAYPIPASQMQPGPPVPGQTIKLGVDPLVEQQQQSPVTPAANQAAESLGNLDEIVRKTVDGFTGFGESMSEFATKTTDSVTKFQQIVGTGLQAISGIAMGIGGAQMIRKGGAYNTLMGAASIFGSISSITGMFGTGGPLSGLFGRKAPSATASNFMMPQLTGVPGGARALGGPVYEGMDYLVGEQGPEVIRMGANGTVVPADELYIPGMDDTESDAPPIGRYARRASSSSESSEMQDGETIYTGNYGRAVPYQRSESTREIDRLERITSNPKELPPIKYETTRVNEYDFVTPEQLEASNMRTAKMARNQTIRELADSMKTRKRLGL